MNTNKFVKNSGSEIESLNDELYRDLSIEELERRLEMGCYPVNICGCDDFCGVDGGSCVAHGCAGNCNLCGGNVCSAHCGADHPGCTTL